MLMIIYVKISMKMTDRTYKQKIMYLLDILAMNFLILIDNIMKYIHEHMEIEEIIMLVLP